MKTVTICKIKMASESEIELSILQFLSYSGLALKINRGGKPIQTNNGFTLVPFAKNIFCKRQINFHPATVYPQFRELLPSDIVFLSEEGTFFFEVKNHDELKKISLWNQQGNLLDKYKKKSYQRIRKQHEFMATAVNNNCYCGFVSGIRHVQHILQNKPNQVYIPSVKS